MTENKKLPDRYVLEHEKYDRLELLVYDLEAATVITEEVREEALSTLDLRYGYTRGSDEFLELEEFYMKVYNALPEHEDNLWYWGIKCTDEYNEHLELINPDWNQMDGEVIYEYAAARALAVLERIGNTELAAELEKWYNDITDFANAVAPYNQYHIRNPYTKITW